MKDKSENTKALILKTAYELFSTHGYGKTPVSLIIKHAGISKGGLYHHFKSKEEIIDALARIQVDGMVKIIEEISVQKNLTAIEKFNNVIAQVQQVRSENKEQLYRLFEAFMRKENILLKDKIDSYTLEKVRPAYVRIIQQGVNEGIFHTISPSLAAECIIRNAPEIRLNMVKIYLDRASNKNYKMEIAEIADFLEEFVLKVLGAERGSIQIAGLFKSFFSNNI